MVFSTRSKAKTTNPYEPFPARQRGTASGSPKRPNKKAEGQWPATLAAKGPGGGSPATPVRDSQGSFADLGDPGSAARPGQWQPRDQPPDWGFRPGDRRRSEAAHVHVDAGSPGIKRIHTSDEDDGRRFRSVDRRRSEAAHVHADAGSPGIKRIQTSDEDDGRRSARGSIYDLQKPLNSKPTFQAFQGSPGMESMSTDTGGNLMSTNTGGSPWSPGRYGRLRGYSAGGATQVFKDEDLMKDLDCPAVSSRRKARGNPQEWTHSEKMRTWEKRLYGDVRTEDHDELHCDERQMQQALDASLSEGFGQFARSPRDGPREGVAGHPAQRGMRAAFTDRSLKQAHQAGHHWKHTEDVPVAEGSGRKPSVGGVSLASFDMYAAGEGATSRRGGLDTMHMYSPGSGPRGSSARYTRSASRDCVGYHLRRSPREPERDRAQVQQEESLLRSKFGPRGPGEMAPSTGRRAHSEEPWAGNLTQRGSNLDLFKDASPRPAAGGGEMHTARRQVQNWLPSDRVTMSQCLSRRDDGAAEPMPIVFVHGQSPATSRFAKFSSSALGGRPVSWSDPKRSYSLGRRRGGGDEVHYSAEATKHSAMRDSASQAMFRYERIASGDDRPRACSQPPVYNPVTHEGELYPSLESTRSQSRGKRPASCARQTNSRSAGRVLDYQAGQEEAEEVRKNRMCNERAFSELCSATVAQTRQTSQDCSQIVRRNNHQKSSNMAQLLTWE